MGPYYYYTFVGFIILKLFSIIWLAWFDVVHIILEYHNILQNRNWCSVLGLYIHWFNMDFNLHLWNTFRDVHFLRVWRKWCARSHCVCLTNFIWRLTSNPKCHVTFSKTKMNVNWHLHFLLKGHLNACLVVRVISRSKMSIDALLFSTQVTLHVKILIVHVNWRAIYFGARFCVSNVKNFVKNTHSKEYRDIFQSKWYVCHTLLTWQMSTKTHANDARQNRWFIIAIYSNKTFHTQKKVQTTNLMILFF
jgi:hypothetical protein